MFFNRKKKKAEKERAEILKIKAEVLSSSEKNELGLKSDGSDADYVVRLINSVGDKWYVAGVNGYGGMSCDDYDTISCAKGCLTLFDDKGCQRHALYLGENHLVDDFYRHSCSTPDELRERAKKYLEDSLSQVSSKDCDSSLKKIYKRALYAIDDSVSVERDAFINKKEEKYAKNDEKRRELAVRTEKDVSSFLRDIKAKWR